MSDPNPVENVAGAGSVENPVAGTEPVSSSIASGISPPNPAGPPKTATSGDTVASGRADWRPDPRLLDALLNLGISEPLAVKALFYTGNASADTAAEWIFDNPDAENGLTLEQEALDASLDPEFGVPCKMVFVVNGELKMGLGKIAAQVGHATLSLYRRLLDANQDAALSQWDINGETKVVLRGESTAELSNLAAQSELAGLHSYLVQDAGRTQIAPGSVTVLSIFGPASSVDSLTGKLKLL